MRTIKRWIATLLMLSLLVGMIPAYAAESVEPEEVDEAVTGQLLEEVTEPETEPATETEAAAEAEEEEPSEDMTLPRELPEVEVTEEQYQPRDMAEGDGEPNEGQQDPTTAPEEPTADPTQSQDPTAQELTEPATVPTTEVIVPVLDIPASGKKNLTLYYDDRYSFAEQYPDYVILEINNGMATSYQVVNGKKTRTRDTAVLTQTGDTGVRAVGTGESIVTLVPKSRLSEAQATLTPQPIPTEAGVVVKEEKIPALQVRVTVKPAKLTLFFLAGQSNMEGLCSGNLNSRSAISSVACEPGMVYSTFLPTLTDTTRIKQMTGGIKLKALLSSSNWAKSVQAYFPASMTSDKALSGSKLSYPMNALTSEGKGKTGIDSALGYEWNRLTGEKVWLVNAGWNASSIRRWQPGQECYERGKAAFQQAVKLYQEENSANHYYAGRRIMFWLQGEADNKMSTETYTRLFLEMRKNLKSACAIQYTGIISVRAANAASNYRGTSELRLTGPRLSQYALASNNAYKDIYIVSNVNEEWVSDSGVKEYFTSAYPSGRLNYPMRKGASRGLPSTEYGAHPGIHFTQQAHNENGFTAARGMYEVIRGTARVKSVQWRGTSGALVKRLMVGQGKSVTVLPQVTPVTASKQVNYAASGKQLSFSTDTFVLYSNNGGCFSLTAKSGSQKLSSLPVAGCSTPTKLKAVLTNGGVQVKWAKSANAQRYRVFYKVDGGSWTSAGDTDKNTLVVKKLTSGTTYSFTVRCVSSNGKVNTSDFNRKGVSLTYYAAPILRTPKVSGSSVTLTWKKVGGISAYRVYYKRPSGRWTSAGVTSANTFTMDNLGKGTWYFTLRCLKEDKKTPVGWYDSAGKKVDIP